MRSVFSRYRRFFLITLVFLLGNIVAFYFSDISYRQNLSTAYVQLFEKKGLSELDLYHTGHEQLVKDFYNSGLLSVSQFASDSSLRAALVSGNSSRINTLLGQYRSFALRFNTITVFDRFGTQLYVSSDFSDVQQFIGQKFAYRDYIQRTLERKKPYVAEIVNSATGRVIQVFAAPVLDEHNDVQYIITGSVTLDNLATLSGITSSFSEHTSLLLDSSGNLILENGTAPAQKINLKERERSIEQLILTGASHTGDELNYLNTKVFFKASKVDLIDGNQVFLVSFYPKSQFESELSAVQRSVNSIFFQNMLRNGLIVVTCIAYIVIVFKDHEKTH